MKKLSVKEKQLIIKEISMSPNILDWSIDEITSIENDSSAKIYILRNNRDQLLGLYVTKRINDKTIELSLVMVISKYRGLGYGKRLLNHYLDNCGIQDKIYTASRNIIVKKFLKGKSFKEVSLLSLPWGILFYLIKNKIKLHKMKSFFKKAFLPGWKHYIKSPESD